MSKNVVIAKILTSHGVRGNVKIESYMEKPRDIFKYSDKLYDKNQNKILIKFVGTLKDSIFLTNIDGINDMDAAKALRNTELFIDFELLPKIKNEEEFYYNQLVGLKVKSNNLNKNGILTNVYDFGAGTIIEIKWDSEKMEETIPFNNDFIKEINLKENYILIDSPEYF